ncbi:uncharacterized protein LOC141903733 [Tubulanus polymorphus]|uniref:uncharacterized protein LOC141903733 n=1 Tax=Tubulanus polymorphus TaxID=672921 RepID=UPI003DA25EDD
MFKYSAILVLVFVWCLLQVNAEDWANEMDKLLDFTCPTGEYIYSIKSTHSNYYQDRRFEFKCKAGFVSNDCTRSDFVNNMDKLMDYVCPNGGILAGVYAEHSNHYDDRRFKLTCCGLITKNGLRCGWSDFLNSFNGYLNYQVPAGKAIVGMYSTHSNSPEDRRFKVRTCEFATCKATRIRILDEVLPTETGQRVVGITTAQACSPGSDNSLSLSATDSVTETTSVTVSEGGSFTFESTISVEAEASAGFLGNGGSVTVGFSQSFGGSTSWETSTTTQTSTGTESSSAKEISFTGPGAALVIGHTREYTFNTNNINAAVDVVCSDGVTFVKSTTINLSAKSYGVTHYDTHTAQFTSTDHCTDTTRSCIRNIEGEKGLEPDVVFNDFESCFSGGIATVYKKK